MWAPSLPGLISFVGMPGVDVEDFRIVDTDPLGSDQVIDEFGATVEYRKSVPCPCVRVESGITRASCPVCGGLKYAYPPDLRFETTALLPGQGATREQAAMSSMQGGGGSMTFKRGVIPEPGDLVLPSKQRHIVSEVIVRQASRVDPSALDALRDSDRQAIPRQIVGETALRYPVVERVIGVWCWDGARARATLAQYGVDSPAKLPPGQLAVFYRAGLPVVPESAYTLHGTALSWHAGAPEPGTPMTVKYLAPDVFMVVEDAAWRADGDKEVIRKPVRVVRYDALGRDDGERRML